MTASTMPNVSDNNPSSVLLEVIQKHYASLYRLALASLDDTQAARKATAIAFAGFWLEETRPPGAVPDQRLYELALRNFHKKESGHLPVPVEFANIEPDSSWMLEPAIVKFNQAVDRLGIIEHHLLVLVYVLGWRPDQAGELLGVSQKAAVSQLSLFHSRLCPLLEKAPESAIPSAGDLPELPKELGASADRRAAAILQARWPAPELTEAEIDELSRQIEMLAESMRQQRVTSTPYRRLTVGLVAAAVLLLCLTAGLGAWLLNAQGLSTGPQRTPTATAHGASTAFPQVTLLSPLTRRSSDEDIRQRWVESPSLWHSLSADVQTWRYGPLSYYGLPRSYRDQAWILQPDQSIVLNGLLGEPPGQSYLIAQDRVFRRSAAEDESHSEPWDGSLESLLPGEPLRSMIFPTTSRWASQPGEFRPVQTTSLAGREAVVFDWTNPGGQREARLWLDAQTGIILRAQIFADRDDQTLIDDCMLTSLALERSQPPPGLVTGARLGRAQPASGDPAFSALPPTPTPAAVPVDRPSTPINSAPPGFNPTGSALTFHFTRDPQVANATTDTAAQPAELIADGYNLGKTLFGLPWTLRCDRSPDGQRLAFNTASDGATPADDSVRWFNLSKPQAIYQPLPDLEAVSFAFSPDSRRLAVAGQGGDYRDSGVYLVDLGTGESRLLLAVDQAHSLVWSPDGEFLALIGIPEGQETESILVLHVRTSQLAYQSPPGAIDQTPADSPITAWGTPFPVEMGGMDDCAAPPQP
ncbi:MAG: hypothetical protein A2W35_03205 [Chloroflexi bacterium RBG_16_57_11]|nr:MAG: hypothetical protein A2W35_03205 [Chloroflexi bacterium RBG_16_57_11]